ncbi:MAG: FtsB family cell division protein [Opitutaceae bacterium]
MPRTRRFTLSLAAFSLIFGPFPSRAADLDSLEAELRALRGQNAALKAQVERQQTMIEEFARRYSELRGEKPAGTATESRQSAPVAAAPAPAAEKPAAPPLAISQKLGKIQLSGEGAVAYFGGQRNAYFSRDVFRPDELKLFLEAPLGGSSYFFTEVDVFTRDSTSGSLRSGELYLELEGVSRLWGRDGQMTLRLGRVDIPFGEEYAQRDVIDNPLISHSVADFWGIDEGIEAFGTIGGVQYVLAAQNGGTNFAFDFASSKAVTLRVGFDPTPGLHFSLSGIRTGRIFQTSDTRAELWFGNDWIRRRTGSVATNFWADGIGGDLRKTFRSGHLAASAGRIRYRDDDPTRRFATSATYASVEGVARMSRQLHFGARFSLADSDRGFNLIGDGLSPSPRPTEFLWRLSLGGGYQLTPHLLLKGEYSLNRGRWLGGARRDGENQVATEAAFKF